MKLHSRESALSAVTIGNDNFGVINKYFFSDTFSCVIPFYLYPLVADDLYLFFFFEEVEEERIMKDNTNKELFDECVELLYSHFLSILDRTHNHSFISFLILI